MIGGGLQIDGVLGGVLAVVVIVVFVVSEVSVERSDVSEDRKC